MRRNHVPHGMANLIKSLLKEPKGEVIAALFSILSRCQKPSDFRESWLPIKNSISRNHPNLCCIFNQICCLLYESDQFDENAPSAVAELILESFEPRQIKKRLPGTGQTHSQGPAKIEDLQGGVIDTAETGSGNRDFDVVWYKTLSSHVPTIVGGWGLEIKLNVANYIRDPAFERKLRYMQLIARTVQNWTSMVVTVRSVGLSVDFPEYVREVGADGIKLISSLELFERVYR